MDVIAALSTLFEDGEESSLPSLGFDDTVAVYHTVIHPDPARLRAEHAVDEAMDGEKKRMYHANTLHAALKNLSFAFPHVATIDDHGTRDS